MNENDLSKVDLSRLEELKQRLNLSAEEAAEIQQEATKGHTAAGMPTPAAPGPSEHGKTTTGAQGNKGDTVLGYIVISLMAVGGGAGLEWGSNDGFWGSLLGMLIGAVIGFFVGAIISGVVNAKQDR